MMNIKCEQKKYRCAVSEGSKYAVRVIAAEELQAVPKEKRRIIREYAKLLKGKIRGVEFLLEDGRIIFTSALCVNDILIIKSINTFIYDVGIRHMERMNEEIPFQVINTPDTYQVCNDLVAVLDVFETTIKLTTLKEKHMLEYSTVYGIEKISELGCVIHTPIRTIYVPNSNAQIIPMREYIEKLNKINLKEKSSMNIEFMEIGNDGKMQPIKGERREAIDSILKEMFGEQNGSTIKIDKKEDKKEDHIKAENWIKTININEAKVETAPKPLIDYDREYNIHEVFTLLKMMPIGTLVHDTNMLKLEWSLDEYGTDLIMKDYHNSLKSSYDISKIINLKFKLVKSKVEEERFISTTPSVLIELLSNDKISKFKIGKAVYDVGNSKELDGLDYLLHCENINLSTLFAFELGFVPKK